ncbi:MAG: hypothetical protein QG646_4427 [Euryarchaeota archaeon]|nr:hypothetical protein [Euryarchaeota archaeon]
MENKLEEVERDYIEFRKEMEEEEHRKSEKQHIKKSS